NDGHKVHRLARRAAQAQEPGDISRGEQVGCGMRVSSNKLVDAILHRQAWLKLAMILLDQTRLGTLQHLGKTCSPGSINPLTIHRARQLELAIEPQLVRHGSDVTEVHLGGLANRFNDLIPARLHSRLIACNLIKKASSLSKGVVDLVDVCAKLGTARCHSVLCATSRNPFIRALGGNKKFL